MEKDLSKKQEVTEAKPINSATEHYRTVMGMPDKPADFKSMPKPVRWFGYFVTGVVLCALVAMLLTKLLF